MPKKHTETEETKSGQNCPECGSELFDQGEYLYCGECQKMVAK